MWAFDRTSGRILAANAAACRIYGYTRDELRARSVDDICRSSLGSLLDVDLTGLPQDETVWHCRSDRSVFQTEISMIANGPDAGAATVLVHPLILSNRDGPLLMSALPVAMGDTTIQKAAVSVAGSMRTNLGFEASPSVEVSAQARYICR
jgi:hypothetical protein